MTCCLLLPSLPQIVRLTPLHSEPSPQNLGIGDSSDGGWGDEAQGGGSAAAAHISGMVPAAAHGAGVAAPAHMHLPAMATPGLQNEAGEYNCFLNAIIQCLWRCANFRQQVGGKGAGCRG